jgi:NAD-dependent deacetylase
VNPAVLEEAARLLRAAQRVAVLTGAGISAESGIPTFRDALSGLWARYDPEELATPEAFERQPRLVWDWYAERRRAVASARPNAGHLALVDIERRVPRFTLITQNVDGLHAAAGSAQILELHGNISRVRCSVEGIIVQAWEDRPGLPPACPACGGLLRPDVVWFGEMLPPRAAQDAWRAAGEADVFLSVGTSNLVQPAASLPWLAHRHGAAVLVVNPSTDQQQRGERIHHLTGAAGTVLPALVRQTWPDPAVSIAAATA